VLVYLLLWLHNNSVLSSKVAIEKSLPPFIFFLTAVEVKKEGETSTVMAFTFLFVCLLSPFFLVLLTGLQTQSLQFAGTGTLQQKNDKTENMNQQIF
jgi:hypothetical protein